MKVRHTCKPVTPESPSYMKARFSVSSARGRLGVGAAPLGASGQDSHRPATAQGTARSGCRPVLAHSQSRLAVTGAIKMPVR